MQASRIYLDNAATSWPKPQQVYDAVDAYQRGLGVAVGRGGYAEVEEVGEIVDETRSAVARLIEAEGPKRIVFTLNGTDSLNLGIHGLLKPGDHVVTTVAEHNSVIRPLRRLEKQAGVEVTHVATDQFGVVNPSDIESAIRTNTKLIVVTHASNVTGAIQPVELIGQVARAHNIVFMVDAAQTLGHLPISVEKIGADMLAAPGHKGLLGPLGTGLLYIREGVEDLVDSVRQGGTGSFSSSDEQPRALPEKYESGSHNVPGIIGLEAGIKYLEQRGLDDVREHSHQLTEQLLSGLSGLRGVSVQGPLKAAERVGVLSVAFDGQDAPSVAKRLEEEFRIQVRGGFQCAGLMHRSLGTIESNGTVRFSIGPFNTADDVQAAIEAAETIASSPQIPVEAVDCPCVSSAEQQAQASLPFTSPTLEASGHGERAPLQPVTRIEDTHGLEELWSQTMGDTRVCVAILDGPLDLTHECFRGADINIHPSYKSVVPNGGAATQHGTHVASIIFGQHGSSVRGVAPGSHGVSIPVFRDGPDGGILACSQIELARAITAAVDYAKQRGSEALVINISGGQLTPSGEAHPLLKDVVTALDSERSLVVSAAGNQGCECLHVPGSIPSVLAVGAMNAAGLPMPFSNWGKAYQHQGVLAPGENIPGASVGQDIELRTGTSYATPIVTGVVSLLLSRQLAHGESPSANRIRSAILQSAVQCDKEPVKECERLLAGRLNVTQANLVLQKEEITMSNAPQDPVTGQVVTPQDELVQGSGESSTASVCEIPALDQGGNLELLTPANTVGVSGVASDQPQQPLVQPAGCGCGGGNGATLQKVYAIGKLTYDFGTRQRMDYFSSQLGQISDANLFSWVTGQDTPHNYSILEQKGKQFPSRADLSYITWVLQVDATPVYALAPVGPFALDIHDTLLNFLRDQLPPKPSASGSSDSAKRKKPSDDGVYGEDVERMAVGGTLRGETRLYTGEVVPVLEVDYRTLANWTTRALVEAVVALGAKQPDDRVEEILDHLYESTRNLGLQSKDRALNFAATMGIILAQGLGQPQSSTVLKDMILDFVDVQPSPICRPDADCWDVIFTFFDPNDDKRARRGFRYTVDVTDTLPTQIPGSLRPFIAGSRR